jgi:hypothetical protein
MSRKLSFDFKRRRRGRDQDRPLGLVVGPKALVIYRDVTFEVDGRKVRTQEVVFDGVAEMERAFRMGGGRVVEFEGDADGEIHVQPPI